MNAEMNLEGEQSGLVEQYKNPSKLETRIQFHGRFSVSERRWGNWVFDQFEFPSHSQILELGCGIGNLWRLNRERIGMGWSAVLGDFSQGMVEKARANLEGVGGRFHFAVIEAGDIPFGVGRFDVVIANHMLYHVPDVRWTLGQICRVLKPGGRLYASTNGVGHMAEMEALTPKEIPFRPVGEVIGKFTLENGGELLRPYFKEIELRRHKDGLLVTEAEPIVDYSLSRLSIFTEGIQIGEDKWQEFIEKVKVRMDESGGAIRITKDSGIFIARR